MAADKLLEMINFDLPSLSVIVSIAILIAGAGWWLREQLQKVTDKVAQWMDVHEGQDQRRHEENIERFVRLETKLDIIKNGH